jgi:sugar lactone lactonase YvrE
MKAARKSLVIIGATVVIGCGSTSNSSSDGAVHDATVADGDSGELDAAIDTTASPDVESDGDAATSDAAGDGVITPNLTVAFAFNNQMPTGVAVSSTGRIFVNYPHWEDPITYTVAELRNGTEVPYPDLATNTPDTPERFLSAQSVVVDPLDRLWVLDTGTVNMGPPMDQYPKLVAIDLHTDQIVKTIHFAADVVLPTTYLNDVRFDLSRGTSGMAFITDSSQMGENAFIVVDLATGQAQRRLRDHASTKSDPDFAAMVLGEVVEVRMPGMPPKPFRGNLDGIAISGDGTRLFYTPLTSHVLYSLSLDALADASRSDDEIAATIQTEQRSFSSDGLLADADGHIYLTDWEHNAVWERKAAGQFVILAQDTTRMWWPDSLAMGSDGSLYVTANQLHRQRRFHDGQDLRQKPFYLFQFPGDGRPPSGTLPGGAR